MNTIDKLHYISQQSLTFSHLDAIKKALQAGCKWIQLRIKDESEESLSDYAFQAKLLCESYQAKLIINDYADIAVKSGADGLHLGEHDLPVHQARQLLGNGVIIGATANTFGQIVRHAHDGADYIGLGPYRFTQTKKNLSPVLGLEGYARIMEQVNAAKINIPVIAIGGILAEDIPAILQTGIYGVALSGAITNAADGAVAVKSIKQALSVPVLNSVHLN
ncbi:thiamine phosphate synthase [Pedobacter antarcticus]|uniref:thiamine phosphate synthase n=1 Tax=Pedobacter antarcticus TaxID=34086 RepID=UPI00292D5539|nr:thiamine phosphate synthase [Pedobacter antarcticus]